MKFSSIFTSVALIAPLVASAASVGHAHGAHKRHHDHALVQRSNATDHLHQNQKRFNGQATFYDVGLGACGKHNSAGDFIVALNSAQYGGGYPGPHCFQKITISYKGKSTSATIMDECPTCGFGDLDMSRGLFGFFEDFDKGVFQMTWNYGGSSAAKPKPKPKPKPTPKPDPPKKDDNKDKNDDNKKDDNKKDDNKDDNKDDKSSTPKPTPTASKSASQSSSAPAAAITDATTTGGNIDMLDQVLFKMGALAVRAPSVSS